MTRSNLSKNEGSDSARASGLVSTYDPATDSFISLRSSVTTCVNVIMDEVLGEYS
jgi:hypothetical protein